VAEPRKDVRREIDEARNAIFTRPDGVDDVFVVGVILLLVMFVPCWLGIRLGATFATVLGILTIIPLVLLCVLPLFKPGSLDGFDNLSLSLSSSPAGATGSWQLILGWSFIFTWSVLAMEAAACYIGECREPVRDAKIAITAEGLFGFFVHVTLPIMVFAVLGNAGIDRLANEPMVLFMRTVHQPAVDPLSDAAGLERAVEITVDIVRQGQNEPGVIPLGHEPRGGDVFKAVVIEHNIGVERDPGLMRFFDELPQLLFVAIETRQIKPVEHIVASGLSALGLASRRYP